MISISEIKFDCRYFKGHIPCKPNKLHGVMCNKCNFYDKTDAKILIVKLGAAGDVIRTTPILYPLKKDFPNAKIFWLTYFPDIVPIHSKPNVDEVLLYNTQNVNYLQTLDFDLVINLDKDKEAISLIESLKTKNINGFISKKGICYPANEFAEHKFLTGLFDNISKVNKQTYLEEIFNICNYKFNGEKYILDIEKEYDEDWNIEKSSLVIGLNTGCGDRWTSRLWKNENWISLINKLKSLNFEVILLGGSSEDEKNKFLSSKTGAKYFGSFHLKTFINLMTKCDLIVTQVTMALHIAIGLEKKVVLMNNIFNPNEFELYGKGIIVQPAKECKCYFSPKCVNNEYNCLDFLTPEDVYKACQTMID